MGPGHLTPVVAILLLSPPSPRRCHYLHLEPTLAQVCGNQLPTRYPVTHVSGTSLTACYGVVALLYGLGSIGLRVTILGPLYFAAAVAFTSSDGGLLMHWTELCTILLTCLFVCTIPCSVGGTSRTTPSASSVCI
jgi:hypothetical protein